MAGTKNAIFLIASLIAGTTAAGISAPGSISTEATLPSGSTAIFASIRAMPFCRRPSTRNRSANSTGSARRVANSTGRTAPR